jgi:2-polyprenyl-3-methyl-5-hydroxy-6-metoxy-1,4-benzoquinol methylase
MILSPLTKSSNILLKDKISSKVIVDLYKEEFDVDVDRFFSDLNDVSIYQCLDSGLLFYYPETLSGDETFYDELKTQMPIKYNSSYYPETKWEYDICLKIVKPNDKVYEVGAGNGTFLKKLRNKGVMQIFGTELNMESIKSAAEYNIKLDNKTIQEKAKETEDFFDVVCTFQVLEHISEIHSFIEACLKVLKRGGKFIIAVPYNSPYLFKKDKLNTLNMPPHHMALWNKKSFENLGRYFPVVLNDIIIEKLPAEGYDFDRYFKVNKDSLYPLKFPLKRIFDGLYFRWLKRFHSKISGKNIIAVYEKK